MNRYEAVWVGLLAAATAYEIYGLRRNQQATLSQATRHLFVTGSPAGRVVFIAGLGAAAVWYADHVAYAPTRKGVS